METMKRKIVGVVCLSSLLVASFSLQGISHSGTENEVVKARMASMSEIAANMKSLSKISRGRLQFDIDEVKNILAKIESNAAQTPKLFEVNATDPTSEAASEIWENFQDFSDKAFALQSTAENLINTVASIDDLPVAVQSLGGTCKSCHSKYRN